MVTSIHQRTLPVQESTAARLKNNAYYYKRQLQRWTFHPLLQSPLLFMMIATCLSTTIVLWRVFSVNHEVLPSSIFVYPLVIDPSQQFFSQSMLPYLFLGKNIPPIIGMICGYFLAQREQAYLSTFLFISLTLADLGLSLMVIMYISRLIS